MRAASRPRHPPTGTPDRAVARAHSEIGDATASSPSAEVRAARRIAPAAATLHSSLPAASSSSSYSLTPRCCWRATRAAESNKLAWGAQMLARRCASLWPNVPNACASEAVYVPTPTALLLANAAGTRERRLSPAFASASASAMVIQKLISASSARSFAVPLKVSYADAEKTSHASSSSSAPPSSNTSGGAVPPHGVPVAYVAKGAKAEAAAVRAAMLAMGEESPSNRPADL